MQSLIAVGCHSAPLRVWDFSWWFCKPQYDGTAFTVKRKGIAFAMRFCQHLWRGIRMQTKTAIISIADLKDEHLPVLRDVLSAVPGVGDVDFSVERSVAVLEFDPSQSHIDDFLRALLKAGFKVL
jgi:hypothetical protein